MNNGHNKENIFLFPPFPGSLSFHASRTPSPKSGFSRRLHPYYRSPVSRSPIPFDLMQADTPTGKYDPLQPEATSLIPCTQPSSPCEPRSESPFSSALSLRSALGDLGQAGVEGIHPPQSCGWHKADRNNLQAQVIGNAEAGTPGLDVGQQITCGGTASEEYGGETAVTAKGALEASGDEAETAFPELLSGELPWEDNKVINVAVYGGAVVPGRVLDEEYLTSCRFYHHDPRRPLPTNFDIIIRMCNYFGPGVTRSELRQALRRCKACRRFMYADSRGFHRCDAPPLSTADRDLIAAFLLTDESSGFASQDLRMQLTMCGLCDHVLLSNVLNYHSCGAV
ncbi:hypothetical protein NMY22_g8351 [Coprinellus aureogranulatus]|nr:hypothetical protein NMY22_g8351 [Coprinellus aureogranulatus]